MTHKMTKHIIIAALVLIVTTAALILVWPESSNNDRWDDEAQQLTIERARPIINAIEAYRDANGDEPETLNSLLATHLREIEPPIVGGQQWQYRNTEHGYTLTVPSSDDTSPSLLWMMIFGPPMSDQYFVYSSSRGTWEMSDI